MWVFYSDVANSASTANPMTSAGLFAAIVAVSVWMLINTMRAEV